MTTLKLTRIGNSVGVVLPKDVLARLRVTAGDALYISEEPGGYRLSAYDAEFEAQMSAAETVMRENRDVLRLLAK
jgi:putative addiction module antidote